MLAAILINGGRHEEGRIYYAGVCIDGHCL